MPDVEELPGQMTLQEKVALLAGTHDWYTVPVERLGIPSLKMTDGPNGARGAGGFTGGMKGAQVLLAPTVNIQRSPLGGLDAILNVSPKTPTCLLAWRCPTSPGYSEKGWEHRSSIMSVTTKSSSASASVPRCANGRCAKFICCPSAPLYARPSRGRSWPPITW